MLFRSESAKTPMALIFSVYSGVKKLAIIMPTANKLVTKLLFIRQAVFLIDRVLLKRSALTNHVSASGSNNDNAQPNDKVDGN